MSNEKDPIRWWGENQNAFPLLSKLARQYLAYPPSSVASERLFSEAGQIYDERRNRLLGENPREAFIPKKQPTIHILFLLINN